MSLSRAVCWPPRLLVALLLAILAGCAARAPAPLPIASGLSPDPAVRHGILPNGLRYALLANDTPPGEASIRLAFDFGSLMERDGQEGLAHFIEHMAFNGTRNVPEGEMVKTLERLGLAFGADTNASTGFDQTVYQLDLPDTGEEVVDTALRLLREVASEVLFEPAAIDRERGVLLSELRVRDTPGFRAWQDSLNFLLPAARLTKRLPGGLASVIETAGRNDFLDLYQRYYRPERAVLVVVGDLDLDQLEARIDAHFGSWQGVGEGGEPPLLGEVRPRPAASRVFQEEGIFNVLSLNTVTPWELRPDTLAERIAGLRRAIALGIINRRLQTLARGVEAPFLGAAASRSELAETAVVHSVRVSFSPGQWEPALAAGEQALRRALQHGFTAAEVDEQVANIRTSLENAARAAETRSNPGLAGALLGTVTNDRIFTRPADDLDAFEAAAGSLTPETVHQALASAWPQVPWLVHATMSDPLPGGEGDLQAALEATMAVAVAPPESVREGTFAYTDFGPPGTVVARELVPDLGFETVRFANGVRLNVKQTDFQDNQVLARVSIGDGMRSLPPSLAGLDLLTGIGLVAGGLEAHSADELQRLLAGRAVSASASLGEASLLFGSNTTPRDLLLQFQLWTAFLTAPGYRDEAQAQFRRLIEGTYATIEQTPGGVLQRDLARLLRGGDPRYGIQPREVLEALDLAQLETFLAPRLTTAPLEVAVVGDIDPEAVVDIVGRTLGALPDRDAPVPHRLVDGPRLPPAGRVVLEHKGSPEQAVVVIHWPTTDGGDRRLALRVDLLGEVLQLRLTNRIREELGATYSPSVGAFLSGLYAGYGYLAAQSEVAAGDVEQLIEVIAAVIEGAAREPVTADELERARQPMLERIETSRERNGYWLSVIDQAQGRPDTLELARIRETVLAETTPADLDALARRFLDRKQRYVITVEPEATPDP